MENNSKILGEELVDIINQALELFKCETCISLKNKVDKLNETLVKISKSKENLDLILSNQRASYNNNGLG